MTTDLAILPSNELPVLLRGEAEPIQRWTETWSTRRFTWYVVVIVAGAGLYGASLGIWRAPTQAVYTAIKFPTIILLTAAGNSLLNGMLAPLLGLNIPFRQTFMSILMSFAIACTILGSFSPLLFFLVWNIPPRIPGVAISTSTYNVLLLSQVAVIAFAGIAANIRLLQLLYNLAGRAAIARNVLLVWLAGNFLLGSQLSWNLRPFVGSPGLPLQFLRPNAFESNFFESVYWTARSIMFPNPKTPKE